MSLEFGTTTSTDRELSFVDTPRISVVVPVRNSKDLLDEQLEALACQRGIDGQIEVVIADNKSEDGLEDHIRTHRLRAALQLRYVFAGERDGASYARNAGAVRAGGDVLAFCDADDLVHSDWLSTLVDALESTDIAGTAVETERLNTQDMRESVTAIDPDEQGKTTFLPFVIGASFACRKSTYLALGGMHEDLLASEDVEFSWRAQLAGYSVHLIPRELVSYRLRTDTKAIAKQALQLGMGSAQLQKLYLHNGCPRVSLWKELYELAALVAVRPLVPTKIVAIKKPIWIRSFNAHLGMVRGTVSKRRASWSASSVRTLATR